MKDYDETTELLGHWGRFQQIIFFFLCASTIPNGLGCFSIVFLAGSPSHHCLIPDVNLTQEWNKAIIPVKVMNGEDEVSQCSRYRLDVVRNLSAQGFIPGRDVNLTDLEQEDCLDGWSYSKDIYQSTIVSEFDLVCSEHWKQPFTISTYTIGVFTGSFFSGPLSDRFGRKPVLFVTIVLQMMFSFFQIFSPSWTVFNILFFLSGLGQISNYIAAFVLGTEIFQGNVRVVYCTLGVNIGFVIGYMMLPLFAYFLQDWKSLLVVISLFGLVYIPFWGLIPESPRWLLSQGRVKEAEVIVRRAAKQNKVQAPEDIFDSTGETKTSLHQESEPERHYNILDIIKIGHIRTTTLILFLLWFSTHLGYTGLSLNSANLHANPYLSSFLLAVVEVPSYFSSWLAIKVLPRRLSLSGVSILGAVSLYIIQLMPQSLPELNVSLEMLGKYAITTGNAMLYVYTAELYPTAIRNTATGMCSVVARVASTIAPFILELRFINKYLPNMIMGTLALACAVSTVFLPESFRQPLPETLEQMPKRGRIVCPCVTREERTKPVVVLETQL
ncbi:solute carrier family 22 member 4-like [Genypterus blacodes]|uniref:solute carrier family 22 member 4-like n=1 Tax=Genypterus blacodes TaxID=154954 RepID=UPI003F75AB4F